MITKKLLDSLKGKTVLQALSLCKKAGHETKVLDCGVAITLVLRRPNTVIMWRDKSRTIIEKVMNGEGK